MSCVGVLVKRLLATGQRSCKSCLQCPPAFSTELLRHSQGKCHLHLWPGCPASTLGSGNGPEIRRDGEHGCKEMQQWGFSRARSCEHRRWPAGISMDLLAAVTPSSKEAWQLLRVSLQLSSGQGTTEAEVCLGRCPKSAATGHLPGNGRQWRRAPL